MVVGYMCDNFSIVSTRLAPTTWCMLARQGSDLREHIVNRVRNAWAPMHGHPQHATPASRDQTVGHCHGSMQSTSKGRKCLELRVATVIALALATAAISASS